MSPATTTLDHENPDFELRRLTAEVRDVEERLKEAERGDQMSAAADRIFRAATGATNTNSDSGKNSMTTYRDTAGDVYIGSSEMRVHR